jgi:hypothetical protein
MNDMDGKLKLVCGNCETIFYVLTDRLQCPECNEMVDPRAGFNLKVRKTADHHKDKACKDVDVDVDLDADLDVDHES